MKNFTRVETEAQVFINTPQSNWIKSFLYDKDDRVLVMTGYNKDTRKPVVYAYENCPSHLFAELEADIMAGNSAGRFFNIHIKPVCEMIK
jgi:hypothetical protein